MNKKVIVIVGPTASGKSTLGIKLAQKIDGEIISCDSMQVYKGLDAGTAKVTKEEQATIKHHLIDICDVEDEFSVADFKRLCYDKIDEIIEKNKIPIIVGGTGLYVNSVIYDLDFCDGYDDKEVKKYRDYLSTLDTEKLYEMLVKVDKQSAENIHKNNVRRVIRALEIAKFGDKTKSEHLVNEKNRIENLDLKYDFFVFYLDTPREILYENINLRTDSMLKEGKILKEARFLYDKKENISNTCKQAIGYKEFFPYFSGEDTLENCVSNLKKATRNYAKRQITWFKNKLDSINLDMTKGVDANLDIMINYIEK